MVKLVGTRKQEMLFPTLLFIGDSISLIFAALLVYAIRFASGLFPTPLGVPALSVYLAATAVSAVVILAVFYQLGHYRGQRVSGLKLDIERIGRGLGIGYALQLSFLFFYRGFSFSRSYVGIVILATFVLLLVARKLHDRMRARGYERGKGILPIALLGRSAMTESVWRLFSENPGYGYKPIGIIEEGDAQPHQGRAFAAVACGGASQLRTKAEAIADEIPVLGASADLEQIVFENELDTVVLTLPFERYGRFVAVTGQLSSLNVKTLLVPDLVGLLTSRLYHFDYEGLPFLAFRHVPLSGLSRVLKRSIDLIVAGLGLLLASPLLLGIMLAILLLDGRPIFYSQERLGRDGRRFHIRKFRSMRVDAELGGAGWTSKNDGRRTRLGGLLRRSSMDELPQLWNVLVGEMSLVGPRPERPEYVEAFAKAIPRYFERHRVRSGITGWAQVNGHRGDTPIEERTRFDLFYVENWSLATDLKILWLTVRAVLKQDNAY